MNIIADTHTHTLASTHAYSTILENAKYASEIGLKYLAITDHAPSLTDAPHLWHFINLRMLPETMYGVKILKGIECSIVDDKGTIDMESEVLHNLDWVIASFHGPAVIGEATYEFCTNAYINLAKNPLVDVIGHSESTEFEYDYEKVLPIFKEYNKLVEINENSYVVRSDSRDNCVKIANLCKELEIKVVVNSDAHFAYSIGNVSRSMAMLEEIDFPHHLIVNSNEELFNEYRKNRRKA